MNNLVLSIQRIDGGIQRTVQFYGDRRIILRFHLIPPEARPGLHAADRHFARKGVCELVIRPVIENTISFTNPTVRFNTVLGFLRIGTVNGHAAVIQFLLEPVDILPSLVVIQGQIGHLSPPVVSIVHSPDRILAVDVRLIRWKLLYRCIGAVFRFAL